MKIAIFGGTFNPVTKGHTNLAEFAIKSLDLDLLYFVPTNKTPLKKLTNLVSNEHRFKMLDKVLKPNMKVSSYEINKGGVSYTIDTIKYFKSKFKNDQLYFLIGSDNVPYLNKWKKIREISSLAKIVVFKRSEKFKHINLKKYNCLVLKNELFSFSSSEFKNNHMEMVDSKVLSYISQNHLYLKDILKNNVNETRYKHCLATGDFAANLAKNTNENPKIAYIAGLMHDLTKNWSIEKHRNYLSSKNIDEKKFEDFELHSKTASVFLEKDYKLKEKEVITAICKHTTLDKKMSVFEKIVFAADKLCRGRKWPGIQKHRELIMKDFNQGFKTLLETCYADLLKAHKVLPTKTTETYQSLINN